LKYERRYKNVAHVKTAISLDESLFREAEEWAGKLGVSRSQLFARAVEEYVRRHENEELVRRLDEAHADGLDDEEREHLERMWVDHARLLEETGNEWRPRED
jgi:metal-responsive CopG/Arc/MetJ family transcriptional regulator